MLRLRRFLCSCFGFFALIFAVASAGTIPSLVLRIQKQGVLPPIHATRMPLALAIFIAVLASVVLLMPVFLAFLYGIAWWKVRSGNPAGRLWAIAARLSMILQCIPLFFIEYLAWNHGSRGHATSSLALLGSLVAIGVAGLVVFTRRQIGR